MLYPDFEGGRERGSEKDKEREGGREGGRVGGRVGGRERTRRMGGREEGEGERGSEGERFETDSLFFSFRGCNDSGPHQLHCWRTAEVQPVDGSPDHRVRLHAGCGWGREHHTSPY